MKARQNAMLPMYILWGILLSVVALLPAGAQTTTYSGDTSIGGVATFHRPSSFIALSVVGTNVPYQTYTFRPTTSGNYRIRSIAGYWDNFLFVYTGSFNPAQPLTNLLMFNDDANGQAGASLIPAQALTANTDYIIVTTGFGNGDKGTYTNLISPAVVNGDTTGASTFARPDSSNSSLDPGAPIYPVDAISTSANAVRYQAKTFSVTEAGLYRIQSEAITPGYDPFTILYKGTFNPAQPLTNVVIANDDFGSVEVSGFDIGLDANQTYTLVTTGADNAQFGQYYYSYQKLYNFRAGFSG